MVALTNNNDVYSAPLGEVDVDALAGDDRLVVNYSSLTGPIRYETSYGWQTLTDDIDNRISYINFESYDITGGAGSDDLRGGNNSDVLKGGAGDDALRSGLGADVIDGGAGAADRWIVDYDSFGSGVAVSLLGGGATFTVAATGAQVRNVEALTLNTGVGDDVINTSAVVGDDVINTGDGNDSVAVGLGTDQVNGGGGDDLLIVNYASLTGDITRADVGYGWMRYDDGEFGTSAQVDYYGFERFNITGGSGNDELYGGAGNDVLKGNAGDDALNGGAGVDAIDGGAGTDRWSVDYGSVLANVSISIAGAAGVVSTGATVSNIEQITATTGIGNDSITANAGQFNDVVNTGDGNDVVRTGRGIDNANGGGGDDLLVMNWAAATGPIGWSDQGYGWQRYSTGSGDQLDFYGFERFNLAGGSGNDTLYGRDGVDTLAGGAGNDLLDSGRGDATIDGGAGNDVWAADLGSEVAAVVVNATSSQTAAQGAAAGLSVRNVEAFNLTTGAGADSLNSAAYALNDSVATGANNDLIYLGRGHDSANGGDGLDTLVVNYSTATTAVRWSDAGYGWGRYGDLAGTMSTRYYGIEKFQIYGGAAADQLRGGGSDDVLSGYGGNDILNGFGGRDTINGGAGTDRWIGDQSSAVANLSLTLNAAGNGTLTGIGTVVVGIEQVHLTTGAGADTINTSAVVGNDNVATGNGNDSVNLGRGLDRADGGGGNDLLTFDFSTSTTSITRSDIGYGWQRYGDAAGLNRVDFSGFEQLNMTGGAADDRLFATGNDDVIRGGGGNDLIEGGAGNDVLTGGAGSDLFRYGGSGNGTDTITDAAAGDAIRVLGRSFAGTVTAGNGATVTANQVQAQTAGGVTTLYVGTDGTAGADVVIHLTGTYAPGAFQLSGQDIRLVAGSSTSGTQGADTLIGTSGNDSLSGGVGNDRLEGKAGDDLLDGGADNDLLIGGAGRDAMTGGLGADRFLFASAAESQPGTLFRDLVSDFSTAQLDKIDLSAIDANPVLAGNQAFSFIGASAFSGAAGQVRFAAGVVEADVNGDGVADLQIELTGVTSVAASDFLL